MPAPGAGSGTSNPAPAADRAPSSEPIEDYSEEPQPTNDELQPGDGPSPAPPSTQPGCYTHSLKLTSEHTLCQSNIQLCRPGELVGDIKDLAFIGNGSFAAVFKGKYYW